MNKFSSDFYILICLLIFIVLFFYSPFLFFIFGLLSLCFFSPFFNNKYLRICLVVLTCFFLIIIISSRSYYDELSSDLSIYYNYYKIMQVDLKHGLRAFGGGLEVGWPLLYWLIGKFINLNPIHLAVCNTIISLFLVFLWLEKKIIPNTDIKEKGILYFFIFLFANFLMLGFLQRQSLTLGFLLFALTAKNNRNFLFFILIATIFHISSILVGLLIYISRKLDFTKRKIILLILTLVGVRVFLTPIILLFISFLSFDAFSHKAQTFIGGGFSISTLRYFILYLCLFPFLLKVPEFSKIEDKYLYNYAILTAVSIVSFVGIPLFADRIFMIGLLVFGLFYYRYFFRKYKIIGLIFSILYLFVFMLEKFNIMGSLALGDSFWSRYNYWGTTFLYYLERF